MAAEKLAAVEAEVTAEVDDGSVVVELVTDDGKEDIRVPAAGKWKSRANTALAHGDFESWADMVLAADDRAKWLDLDPTNDDLTGFFDRWKELAGQDLGKLRSSRPSSRSTRRR
jgi:hypothetical protein